MERKQISGAAYTSESYKKPAERHRRSNSEMEKIWPSSHLSLAGSGTNKQPVLEQKEFTAEEQAAMVQKAQRCD